MLTFFKHFLPHIILLTAGKAQLLGVKSNIMYYVASEEGVFKDTCNH